MTTTARSEILKTALIIVAAFLAYGLVAGLRASSGTFVSAIADLSGLSYGSISTVATIRNLVYAVACPVFGFLTLRRSHTFCLVIGLALSAIGFLGVLVFPSYPGLVVFQGIFFGIGAGALCYSIVYAAAAPFLSEKTAIVFAGILCTSQGFFNIVLAPAVTISLGFDGGFLVCMAVIAAACLAIIPLTFVFKRRNRHADAAEPASGRITVKDTLKSVAKSPFFYLIAISFFIYGLCQGEMMNHLLKRATMLMGLDVDGATAIVMIYGFALLIGPMIAGVVSTRVANKRFALATMFLLWAVLGFFGMVFIPADSILTVILTFVLGVVIAMAVPYHALLTRERVPFVSFAAVFSLISMFEVFGYAANAFFGGLCFDLTGSFIGFDFVVIGAAAVIGAVFIIDGLRKRKLAARKTD